MSKYTAKFVQIARESLGLSQPQFGKLIGRTKRSIIRYEQGAILPPAIDLAIRHLLTRRHLLSRVQERTNNAFVK